VAHASITNVSSTIVANNGGHGIFLQPNTASAAITAQATFSRVEAYSNGQQGIGIFGNMAPNIPFAFAVDCVVTNNGAAGFYALSAQLNVFRSAAFENVTNVLGDTGAYITVSQSNIERALANQWSGPGTVLSYGDNYSLITSAPSGIISKN
jgi:hypothetical protein